MMRWERYRSHYEKVSDKLKLRYILQLYPTSTLQKGQGHEKPGKIGGKKSQIGENYEDIMIKCSKVPGLNDVTEK